MNNISVDSRKTCFPLYFNNGMKNLTKHECLCLGLHV